MQTYDALAESVEDMREAIRGLMRRANNLRDAYDAWEDIAGGCWRLLEDLKDIDTLTRDGLGDLAAVESWLGECEDLLNEAATAPQDNDEELA